MTSLDVDLEMAIVDDESMVTSFISKRDSNWSRSQKVMRNVELLLVNSTRRLTDLIIIDIDQCDVMVPSTNTSVVKEDAST